MRRTGEPEMSRTALDDAYAAAMEDSSRQMAFYGLFLEAELYFPVFDNNPDGGKSRCCRCSTRRSACATGRRAPR